MVHGDILFNNNTKDNSKLTHGSRENGGGNFRYLLKQDDYKRDKKQGSYSFTFD